MHTSHFFTAIQTGFKIRTHVILMVAPGRSMRSSRLSISPMITVSYIFYNVIQLLATIVFKVNHKL